MASADLDKTHKDRADRLFRTFSEGGVRIDDIFISDDVLGLLDESKLFFQSYRHEQLLATLPFSNAAFVKICPRCVDRDSFPVFEGLTKAGLIIPVLGAPYALYPPEIVELVSSRPHVSSYEYSLFRFVALTMNAESVLCSHCVEKKRVDIEKAILGEDAQRRRKGLQIIVDNIHPYIPPDYDLIDAAEKAVGEPSLEALRQLVDLSFVIHAARDAQAFKAPVLVDDHQLEQLHWHDIDELQQLKLAGLELRELVSAGLGLKVPIDLTVDRYIGLIKEIRPELLRITSELVQSGHDPKQKDVSLRRVFNSVSQINREVERIEQSTRFLLIEAAVGAASSNRELLAGLLAASALGATAGLLACGAGVATGMTAQILRKRGVLKGSVAMKRLGAAIHKDLEPMLTRLVAAYVGANEVPIRVIAIRKKLATARDPTHVQGEQASRTVERARQRRPVRAK